MQNNLSIERSKQEQSAQTTKIKPKWHMTVLHVVYYLIMIAFLVFYMLPFWGTVAEEGEEGYDERERDFLFQEGFRILREYGHHPSFLWLSLGNEL